MPELTLPPNLDLSQLQQQPQIADLLAPDPQEAEREKLLWDKINKGPRQRSKELEAEMWRDRYGVKEDSGKLRRLFAGLGETARGIAGRESYKSIPDMAAERGMKEYQAEVGPLQRELGVLSQAKTAASKIVSQQQIAQDKLAVEQYIARYKAAKLKAERDALVSTTPERIKKLAAETGFIEAKTETEGVKSDNLSKTLGLGGNAGLTMAQSGMDPQAQNNVNRVLFGNSEATAMGRLAGNPSLFKTTQPGTPRTSVSTAMVDGGVGPGGLQMRVPETRTTTSAGAPRQVLDADKATSAVDRFRESLTGVKRAAEEASPVVVRTPEGNSIEYTKESVSRPPAVTIVDGKATLKQHIDPLLKDNLSKLFPDVDFNRPDSVPGRFVGMKAKLPKAVTKEQQVENNAFTLGQRVAEQGINLHASDKLSDSVGFFGQYKGKLAGLRGTATPGQTLLSTASKESLTNFIRAMSGMATTLKERDVLESIKPYEGDNERTFIQKSIGASVMGSQYRWLQSLGADPATMDKVVNNPKFLAMPREASDLVMKHLEAARSARRNGGQETYQIGNESFKTKNVEKIASGLMRSVNRKMQNIYLQEFPDGQGFGPAASALRQ